MVTYSQGSVVSMVIFERGQGVPHTKGMEKAGQS